MIPPLFLSFLTPYPSHPFGLPPNLLLTLTRHYPRPRQRLPSLSTPPVPSPNPTDSVSPTSTSSSSSPVSAHTRSRTDFLCPLREVAGTEGVVRVHVPFSLADLSKVEEHAGSFLANPTRYIKEFR